MADVVEEYAAVRVETLVGQKRPGRKRPRAGVSVEQMRFFVIGVDGELRHAGSGEAGGDPVAVSVSLPTGVRETIGLGATHCRLGGARVWFLCPVCTRRCGVLYWRISGAPTRLACRICHGLIYEQQARHNGSADLLGVCGDILSRERRNEARTRSWHERYTPKAAERRLRGIRRREMTSDLALIREFRQLQRAERL